MKLHPVSCKYLYSSKVVLAFCLIMVALSLFNVPVSFGVTDRVIVNDVVIPSEQIRILEQRYRIHVLNGNYWYDRISGAWGYRDGLAMGQNLGGPLKATASNGNSKIFINGRELHLFDVRALQQITKVIPGRYWCDAMGNVGFEGGPALVNLWALANAARSRGVRREGILSTYDKTGAAVIGGEVLIKR